MSRYYDYNRDVNIKTKDIVNYDMLAVADMNEIIFASSKQPIIGTCGLATCMAVIIEDRLGNIALGHVGSDFKDIILDAISQMNTNAPIMVTVVPGHDTDMNKLKELFSYLKYDLSNFEIYISLLNLQHYMDKQTESIEFALDTRNKEYLRPDYDKYFEYLNTKKICS